MAKQKRPAKNKSDGPYLAAAFFCENTIEDKHDGALSAIRIIDQIAVTINPDAPPDAKIPIPLSGLLSFKSGDSPGEHTIRLVMNSPSGKSEKIFQQTVPFSEQPHGGANIRLRTVVVAVKGGLFLLDVYLDGKKVTSMPLQIIIQRHQGGDPPSTDSKTT